MKALAVESAAISLIEDWEAANIERDVIGRVLLTKQLELRIEQLQNVVLKRKVFIKQIRRNSTGNTRAGRIKIETPPPDVLRERLKTTTKVALARQLGVARKTIDNRLKEAGNGYADNS